MRVLFEYEELLESGKPALRIEEITPDTAFDLLSNHNDDNRALRPGVVSRYARDMRAGRWREGGEPIYIARSGALLNGQHRLAAVIESMATVRVPVMRNAPDDLKLVADQGARRTGADALKIRGVENNRVVAAAARQLRMYELDGQLGLSNTESANATIDELIDTVDRNPGIVNSVWVGNKLNREVGVLPAIGTALHYLISQTHPEEAAEFFEKMATGALLRERDPILALRRYMLGKSRSTSPKTQAALIIKAFNAWVTNRPVSTVRWDSKQQFPQITSKRKF